MQLTGVLCPAGVQRNSVPNCTRMNSIRIICVCSYLIQHLVSFQLSTWLYLLLITSLWTFLLLLPHTVVLKVLGSLFMDGRIRWKGSQYLSSFFFLFYYSTSVTITSLITSECLTVNVIFSSFFHMVQLMSIIFTREIFSLPWVLIFSEWSERPWSAWKLTWIRFFFFFSELDNARSYSRDMHV